MKLNKDEQIEYLKTRISILEQENKKKYDFIVMGLICLFLLVIGVALLIIFKDSVTELVQSLINDAKTNIQKLFGTATA